MPKALSAYDFSGNMRVSENAIELAVAMSTHDLLERALPTTRRDQGSTIRAPGPRGRAHKPGLEKTSSTCCRS